MSCVLIPKNSRFFPNNESRKKNKTVLNKYTPDHFEQYTEWFYFSHIDPVQRFIHLFGMIVGYILFFVSTYLIFFSGKFIESGLVFLLGIFFYYVLGIISHILYDGGQGKTYPENYLKTLFTVHRVNIETLTGTYDRNLRAFVKKYPFVGTSFELVEIENNRLLGYLFSNLK